MAEYAAGDLKPPTTAVEVWKTVKETYSDLESAPQIFDLKCRLWKTKQGEKEVTIFYNELVSLWQELEQCYNDEWSCSEDIVMAMKKEEADKIYRFLAGLNMEYDDVKYKILERTPFPSLRETFSEIIREETKKKMMLMVESNRIVDASSLAAGRNEVERKKKSYCEACKKFWHTRDICWEIHGKPFSWKKGNERRWHAGGERRGQAGGKKKGHAYTLVQSSPSDYSGAQLFSKEQMELLQTIFQEQLKNLTSNPSYFHSHSNSGIFPIQPPYCKPKKPHFLLAHRLWGQ